jgi:structural maintenance of chromosome 2
VDHVFGNTLVSRSSDAAKTVTFDKDVRARTVTLQGDLFDPAGTLTGGSRPSGKISLELSLTFRKRRFGETL